jgi:hypothetical protein
MRGALCPGVLLSAMDEQDRRRALNEITFRNLNEEIRQANGHSQRSAFGVICECGSADCARVIDVRSDEYEAVRNVSTWFIVAPGHRQSDIEKMVIRDDRFAVVEKLGEAADLAKKTDPRQATAESSI